MNRPLRFGVITIQNVPWSTLVEQWKLIEELGFDTLWVADQFVVFSQPTQPWLDGWTSLAGMAAATSRIRIGTLVTNVALHNPAMLARRALTIEQISNGRLNVGLGSGTTGDPSYSMIGVEEWEPKERVARFREVVEIVDSMLRNEITTYEGKYYWVKGAAMNPRPIQQPRPPFTIAALGPAMLRIAARYADTWNSYSGPGVAPDQVLSVISERNKMLDGLCAEIGRDPDEISRSFLAYGPTAQGSPFASVQAFEDFIGRYREAGLNEFVFYYPPSRYYPDPDTNQDELFERIASEIIPAMKAKAAG